MSATHPCGAAPASWLERAVNLAPGGVHSPVRAFLAVGAVPLAITSAAGARITDSEGRTFVDWVGAWGPALLGHARAEVVEAVERAAHDGLLFGFATPHELELAERLIPRLPGVEMIRLMATGTEAAMTAIRLARAATSRPAIIQFAGGYHGHADGLLSAGGSGIATLGLSATPGVTAGALAHSLTARYNDLGSVSAAFEARRGEVAAVIVEPVAGNMGCIPPQPGFLAGLREQCRQHGALLIFDEVITGLRVAPGGAAGRFGVTPDLILLGKALGGGMPLAALAGPRDLLTKLAPVGPVYQAGTYAAHPLSIAAALATLSVLDAEPDLHERLERAGERLERGLSEAAAAAGVALRVQRVGSMWTAFFTDRPVRSWDDARAVNRAAYAAFFRALLARGVLLPPSALEAAFVSAAHGELEIELTLQAARASFRELGR
jgi:glutamate-1-semialdehyde 2,1-aminomutase